MFHWPAESLLRLSELPKGGSQTGADPGLHLTADGLFGAFRCETSNHPASSEVLELLQEQEARKGATREIPLLVAHCSPFSLKNGMKQLLQRSQFGR